MTNLSKTTSTFLVTLFFMFATTISVNAQTTYFAGISAGTGNTGIRVTGVGYNAMSSSNSGNYNSAFGYQALKSNTTGTDNTAAGSNALGVNNTGIQNSAFGSFAMGSNTSGSNNTGGGYASLTLNTTGYDNTALGHSSMYSNTTGFSNTAIGRNALYLNSTGNSNNALGYQALRSNTTGSYNTAAGDNALYSNSTGNYNTALGALVLKNNTTGYYNTGIGATALFYNTTGYNNTALGELALKLNTSGSNNTATGTQALYSNTTGTDNVAMGYGTLYYNTTGIYNVVVGDNAMNNSNAPVNNVSIGGQALSTPGLYNGCVAVGYNTGVGVDLAGAFHSNYLTNCLLLGDSVLVRPSTNVINAIAIGYGAEVNSSNKVIIGNSSVTSIGGQVGWTTYSDQRLKTNINKSNLGLDFILSLNPVTYNYKAEGQKGILYTGLIAQEVDAAAKKAGVAFSGVDKNGEYWGIRYAELTVPLIKSMQELNDKTQSENEALKTRIGKLETAVALLEQGVKPSSVFSSSLLFQNQPNPFNSSSTIHFILSSSDKNAAIVIRNMNGDVVKQVNNLQASKGSITINASELAAGTYTYSLITNGNVIDTKLMVITK